MILGLIQFIYMIEIENKHNKSNLKLISYYIFYYFNKLFNINK
jgi:hypothetical protein